MKKRKDIIQNEKKGSGIKTFWTIQNSYPVIFSIIKLNKRKAAKRIFK